MEWYFILIICLGIPIIIIIIVYWFFKSNLTPFPTGIISENISCMKNRIVNVYTYTKGSDRIVIDAGFSTKGMKKELVKMDITPEKVSDVFITHSDPDHIGGLTLFSKAKIYFGEGTKVKNPENYKFLKDMEKILVGSIEVQAISTPGHRLGHTTYLIDGKYLFSGDLLRLKAGKVKPFFKMISTNFEQILDSIKKIAKLDNIRLLLTAHTGYTTEFDDAIQTWRT